MPDPSPQRPTAAARATTTIAELNDPEINRLQQQVQRGDLTELRRYLAQTYRTQDWQDRCFVLDLLTPFLQIEALIDASNAEPNAADLLLLLGAYYSRMVWQCRGAKQAQFTSDEEFYGAEVQIQNMMDCLPRVYPLEPNDPTPHVFASRTMRVFSSYEDLAQQEYADAVRIAPDCMPAHFAMVSTRAKKWAGSHAEALQVARMAVRSGRLGSDLPACLFLAHFLVWQYARQFDKDKAEADRYVQDPAVNQELNQVLDRWIGGNYEPRRSSLHYLHQAALWYYLSGDNVRLKRIFTLTGTVSCAQVWKQIGDPVKVQGFARQRVLQKAVPITAKKTGILGWFKQ